MGVGGDEAKKEKERIDEHVSPPHPYPQAWEVRGLIHARLFFLSLPPLHPLPPPYPLTPQNLPLSSPE